jgi:hypothetical protein
MKMEIELQSRRGRQTLGTYGVVDGVTNRNRELLPPLTAQPRAAGRQLWSCVSKDEALTCAQDGDEDTAQPPLLLVFCMRLKASSMRGQPSLASAARHFRQAPVHRLAPHIQRRTIQITSTPTTDIPNIGQDPLSSSIDASSTAGMPPSYSASIYF